MLCIEGENILVAMKAIHGGHVTQGWLQHFGFI